MTAFLPARALTSSIGGRPTPRRRRAAQLGMATVVVVAGLAWPVRAEVAPTITAPKHTPPTSAPDPAVDPPHDTEPTNLGHKPILAPAPSDYIRHLAQAPGLVRRIRPGAPSTRLGDRSSAAHRTTASKRWS
jgi:hypothetical protein